MSRVASRLPSASNGRSRSSLRHDFFARAFVCRSTTSALVRHSVDSASSNVFWSKV